MIKEEFRRYLVEAIGEERALVAFAAFDEPASVSVRFNPFKPSECRFEGKDVAWSRHGMILEERPVFTLDPLFHAGAYYVQDSSSMFVGHVFRELLSRIDIPSGRPFRVLDLCAAPGVKATDIAASLRERFGDDFLLVTNEVMKQRVGILADNMALWGDPNVVVTSDDPSAFASLPDFFDVILADVPCSGEGMFRKDELAQEHWSPDNVALCEARQRRIIADVWPSLRQGGLLVYSTCTFNIYENDGNVAWIADELGAGMLLEDNIIAAEGPVKTKYGYGLVPGFVEGEGQYCSALVKMSEPGTFRTALSRKSRQPSRTYSGLPSGLERLFVSEMSFRERGGTITAVPKIIEAEVASLETPLHVIAAGCAAGMMKGKDLVPDPDLALSIIFEKNAWPSVDVDRQTALAYLHRDTVCFPDAPKGYLIVRYEGLPLGFVKNLGNRCNSLYPQSRRIRMDIK